MTRVLAVLAVLPDYRAEFVRAVRAKFHESGHRLILVAGDVHLDPTVRSADLEGVRRVTNRHLLGRRLLWQQSTLALAMTRADVVILDLNPRSLTAWVLLVVGRLRGRRVLLWGHVAPRAGARSRTAPLRRWMRRRGNAVLSYTWSDAEVVRAEDGNGRVWVAANGLYPAEMLGAAKDRDRFRIIYVGRLEPAKKPMLLLEAFAAMDRDLVRDIVLLYVGDGTEYRRLRRTVDDLGLAGRVEFAGHVTDLEKLRSWYDQSLISVSPGYVGLSLTQSLGFGVPMIVADDEPHAPEVELLTEKTGAWFVSGNVESLTSALENAVRGGLRWDRNEIADTVSSTYSSDAMADGFFRASIGLRQARPEEADGI